METFWTWGVSLSLVANFVLLVLLLGLAREVGVILTRMRPDTALPTSIGPELGTKVETFTLDGFAGEKRIIRPSKSAMNLLLFISPTCPVCEELLPSLVTFAKSYKGYIHVSAISRHDDEKDRDRAAQLAKAGILLTSDPDLNARMGVSSYPFAILLDSDNVVTARGIVNSLEQIESLVSIERFVDSFQQSIPGVAVMRTPEEKVSGGIR